MSDGVARSGFDADLAHGEAGESAFVAAIRGAHVECKRDGKCRTTGNIAIEIRQGNHEKGKGRPSGLSITTAPWWAIEYDDDAWVVIRTSLLKALVRRRIETNGTIMGGDFNRFEIVLLPIDWLLRPGTRVAERRFAPRHDPDRRGAA